MDPLLTVVEEQQSVLLLIVVCAAHSAVETRLPVTSQPYLVLYFSMHEDELPTTAQETLVKVAIELVQVDEGPSLD